MKLTILMAILSIVFFNTQAQEPGYQTYSANMIIVANVGSENHEWENNKIMVNLNYKTGNIRIDLKNIDFYSKASLVEVNNDTTLNSTKFTLKGILPIEQIINQKTYNQEYITELQLINDNIDFSVEVNLKMNIMRTSQQSGSYRVFTLMGTLYNDEINIPAFKGYENEIEIRITFNAFWNN
ncbi:MAG: hypothetical protein HQ521_02980 [Bacteroidetes bacterium]|nr:hypothetical protein [Bacteroidota bacterium]